MNSDNRSTEQPVSAGSDQDRVTQSVPQDSAASPRGWPEKMQLVLRPADQPTIASGLLLSLIIVGFYVWHQSMLRNGLMDIDKADERTAEYQIDINRAEWTEIANLPGIGKGTADAVIRFRTDNGPFQSVEELSNVPGIGPKKLDAIRTHLLPIRSEPE